MNKKFISFVFMICMLVSTIGSTVAFAANEKAPTTNEVAATEDIVAATQA